MPILRSRQNVKERLLQVSLHARTARAPITIDRTPVPGPAVKMSSHLPNAEDNLPVNFPPTSKFTPVARLVPTKKLSESVEKSIKFAQENPIVCDCHERGLSCMQNPDCPCRKMADLVRKEFKQKHVIGTDGPAPFDANEDDAYYHYPLFQCGHLCSCHGKCSLNVLQNSKERTLVVDRFDLNIGFTVMATQKIKKDECITTFTGEIASKAEVYKNRDALSYSFELINKEGAVANALSKAYNKFKRNGNEGAEIIKKAILNNVLFINPLNFGNIGRFCNHDCASKTYLVRVFTHGFSPANMTLAMFAGEDIEQGKQVYVNYGVKYKEQNFVRCLCETCQKEEEEKAARQRAQRRVPKIKREIKREVNSQTPEVRPRKAAKPSTKKPAKPIKKEVKEKRATLRKTPARYASKYATYTAEVMEYRKKLRNAQ